jgi:hypothetical protein
VKRASELPENRDPQGFAGHASKQCAVIHGKPLIGVIKKIHDNPEQGCQAYQKISK